MNEQAPQIRKFGTRRPDKKEVMLGFLLLFVFVFSCLIWYSQNHPQQAKGASFDQMLQQLEAEREQNSRAIYLLKTQDLPVAQTEFDKAKQKLDQLNQQLEQQRQLRANLYQAEDKILSGQPLQ